MLWCGGVGESAKSWGLDEGGGRREEISPHVYFRTWRGEFGRKETRGGRRIDYIHCAFLGWRQVFFF
jgi:hypothetical protein